MKEKIYELIKEFEEKNNVKVLDLLSICTDTMSETIFYAEYEGKVYQCNQMFEVGIISDNSVDELNKAVVEVIRSTNEFDSEKYNVVVLTHGEFKYDYYDEDTSLYGLQKEFKSGLSYLK